MNECMDRGTLEEQMLNGRLTERWMNEWVGGWMDSAILNQNHFCPQQIIIISIAHLAGGVIPQVNPK